MTPTADQPNRSPAAAWIKEYVVGFGLAAALALYGVYALIVGWSYLPGVRGGAAAVSGMHGRGVALAYLVGGLFLFFRHFLEKRCRRQFYRDQVHFVENLLLIVLIAALVYVLLNVGTAG
jgi:hypothetical protein